MNYSRKSPRKEPFSRTLLDRVLIIGYTSTLVDLLAKTLDRNNFQVGVAKNQEEVPEQIDKFHPDLVLLEVVAAEDAGGMEICRRNSQDSIPTLILSREGLFDGEAFSAFAGANDYLTFPFDEEELVARIYVHLRLSSSQASLKNANARFKQELSLLEAAHAQLEEDVEQAIVITSTDGQVEFFAQAAKTLLKKYLDWQEDTELPQPVIEFLELGTASGVISHRNTFDLFVHGSALETGTPPLRTLIFDERESRPAPSPKLLRQRLPITDREAEVLFWIAQGKTSAEIGIILGATTGTIKKHVQNMLEKLNLDSRLAAGLKAAAILHFDPPNG